jgi:hypothetical protein
MPDKLRAMMRKAPSPEDSFVVMKLTHRRPPADTHPMRTAVPDEPLRSRAEKVEPVCLRQRLDRPRRLRWRNTMSKTNDTSKLGHAALDHCRLADTELDAVTGGVGELFLAVVLPAVDGHTDPTWTPRTYAVQSDLSGGVTGARASVYEWRRP